MIYDRPEFDTPSPVRVPLPTPPQLAMMHRSFTQQAAQAERAGEPKDAARWRKLAEGVRP